MGVFIRDYKTKSGKVTKKYYIRYRFNGKLKMESVGAVGEVTKTFATNLLAKRKRQLAMGKHDEINIKIPTLTEFRDEYIFYIKETLKNRSWKRSELSLKHLINFFGSKKINSITSKDIIDYQSSRLRDKVNNKQIKPATINRELACLRHCINVAKQKNRFYGDNPVSKVKFLQELNEKDRILTIEEENKLLEKCPNHLRLIVLTALYTGMRKMEILTLKWSNIDFNNKLIFVEATNSKSKKIKYIPISSNIKHELKKQLLKTSYQEYLFLTTNGEHYKRADSLNSFKRACKRAGLNNVTFHSLRHTFGSRAIEATGNIVAVNKILGHADLKTTMRYVHIDKSLHETVEKVAENSIQNL